MGEQYLCKAKRLDNGEWIKGYLVPLGKKSSSDPDQFGIIEKAIPVGSQNNPVLYNMYIIEIDPQTICRYAGLPDKDKSINTPVRLISADEAKAVICKYENGLLQRTMMLEIEKLNGCLATEEQMLQILGEKEVGFKEQEKEE